MHTLITVLQIVGTVVVTLSLGLGLIYFADWLYVRRMGDNATYLKNIFRR